MVISELVWYSYGILFYRCAMDMGRECNGMYEHCMKGSLRLPWMGPPKEPTLNFLETQPIQDP